jgi:hypothetical protein
MRDNMATLPIHPLADRFPMLPDDEQAELADDIKAHGLLHPIMLDAAGATVVDGRCRLRACKIAGVEPRYERLKDDQDAVAYIVSANLQRRNLTVSQRAMFYALASPEPEKGGRGHKASGHRTVSKQRVSEARALLRMDAPDLVDKVIAGDLSVEAAYGEAEGRKAPSTSDVDWVEIDRATEPKGAQQQFHDRTALLGGIASVASHQALAQGAAIPNHDAPALPIGELPTLATPAPRLTPEIGGAKTFVTGQDASFIFDAQIELCLTLLNNLKEAFIAAVPLERRLRAARRFLTKLQIDQMNVG